MLIAGDEGPRVVLTGRTDRARRRSRGTRPRGPPGARAAAARRRRLDRAPRAGARGCAACASTAVSVVRAAPLAVSVVVAGRRALRRPRSSFARLEFAVDAASRPATGVRFVLASPPVRRGGRRRGGGWRRAGCRRWRGRRRRRARRRRGGGHGCSRRGAGSGRRRLSRADSRAHAWRPSFAAPRRPAPPFRGPCGSQRSDRRERQVLVARARPLPSRARPLRWRRVRRCSAARPLLSPVAPARAGSSARPRGCVAGAPAAVAGALAAVAGASSQAQVPAGSRPSRRHRGVRRRRTGCRRVWRRRWSPDPGVAAGGTVVRRRAWPRPARAFMPARDADHQAARSDGSRMASTPAATPRPAARGATGGDAGPHAAGARRASRRIGRPNGRPARRKPAHPPPGDGRAGRGASHGGLRRRAITQGHGRAWR